MTELLTTIVLWLSINFGISANYDHPRVEFASPARMAALRHKGFSAGSQADEAVGRPGDIVSVYLDDTRTIYLPDGWTGRTPAELSILVHEMVHHLQNAGGLKFACPQEREALAYEAQERWLGLFGHDLLRDFQIDPFTVLVKSKCFY